jgi:O-antigen/teichoic acid export membrane protein
MTARQHLIGPGVAAAVLTLASGLLTLWVPQRLLWWLIFSVLCYLVLRGTHQAEASVGLPRRATVVPMLISVGVLVALAPIVPHGLMAYAIAACSVLGVYLLSAWWFAPAGPRRRP